MAGRWSDLDRPPLHGLALGRGLMPSGALPGGELRVDTVLRTGSTNADLRAAAIAGEPEGRILLAEEQTAGRGRHGRTWTAPPCSGLTFSMLVRPHDIPAERWGWLPLLTGMAVARALQRIGELDVGVKWPNDLVVEDRKLAGILVERVENTPLGAAAVIGIGLNVSLREEELPQPGATSLLLAGSACTDRVPLFRAVVREVLQQYAGWVEAGGDPDDSGIRKAYRDASATLDRPVRIELPGEVLLGTAVDVDVTGALVLRPDSSDEPSSDELRVLRAGEVTHLRPTS